jgi:hypothetical protein
VNGYSDGLYQITHNEAIVDHLYQSGFQSGNYADTILHVHQNAYRLHAIILSRSPYLAHLMSTSTPPGSQRVIYVRLEEEPEVTQEGFAIALGYLYSSVSLGLIRHENARAVLAAGLLLGGMPELCDYAFECCKQSVTAETIGSWVEFIDSIPVGTPEMPSMSVFGPYVQKLREHVFHFLVVTLPLILGAHTPSTPIEASPVHETNGRDALLQIYATVPFEMFKAAVESPNFQIGSDQTRFKFAKDCVEIRKRGITRGTGAEETVVLAFGGSNFGASAVHVTRKLRKRPLWKVNA